jgi:hypothetical protein
MDLKKEGLSVIPQPAVTARPVYLGKLNTSGDLGAEGKEREMVQFVAVCCSVW